MNKLMLVVVLVLSFSAFADIPPSDTSGCVNAEDGAACKTDEGVAGSCVTSTCSKNDYSQGVPPKQKTYECKKCVSSAPKPVPAPVVVPVVEEKKKSGCAAVPVESLVGLALVLAARKRR